MNSPSLVFADKDGNVMEFEPLAMLGRSWNDFYPMQPDDVIALPAGAEIYVLPDRHPVGLDRETGEAIVLERNPYNDDEPAYAVAAFLPAAHTQTFLPAWYSGCEAPPVLPLFAYTALGWAGDGFVACGVRTDLSRRQDPETFNMDLVAAGVREWVAEFPDNRMVKQLSHCATCYGCPAAINLFQGREEGPLPTSPKCNANCLGCISYQPGYGPPSPQQRITITPTPEEIAQVAVKHLERAPNPVVSFGQGCEGEPLLVADVLEKAIRLIRSRTNKGTINLNSNASLPDKVAALADAGLDSLRVSMNSANPETYDRYYRQGYSFDDVRRSAIEMKQRGKFVSLNLFVFPGLTDSPAEVDALEEFISRTGADMVQWRNLNIDPDFYIKQLGVEPEEGLGVKNLIENLPVRGGYFNPYLG